MQSELYNAVDDESTRQTFAAMQSGIGRGRGFGSGSGSGRGNGNGRGNLGGSGSGSGSDSDSGSDSAGGNDIPDGSGSDNDSDAAERYEIQTEQALLQSMRLVGSGPLEMDSFKLPVMARLTERKAILREVYQKEAAQQRELWEARQQMRSDAARKRTDEAEERELRRDRALEYMKRTSSKELLELYEVQRGEWEAEQGAWKEEEMLQRAQSEAGRLQEVPWEVEQRIIRDEDRRRRERANLLEGQEAETEQLKNQEAKRLQRTEPLPIQEEKERRSSEEAEQRLQQDVGRLQREQEEKERLAKQAEERLRREQQAETGLLAKQDKEQWQRVQMENEERAQQDEERRLREQLRRRVQKDRVLNKKAKKELKEQKYREQLAKQEAERLQMEEDDIKHLANQKEERRRSEEAKRLQREQVERQQREKMEETTQKEDETRRRDTYASGEADRLATVAEAQVWQESARRLLNEADEVPVVAEVDGVRQIGNVVQLPSEPYRLLVADSVVSIGNGRVPAENAVAPLQEAQEESDLFCSLRGFDNKRKHPDAGSDAIVHADRGTNGALKRSAKSLSELYGDQAQQKSTTHPSRRTSPLNAYRPAIVPPGPISSSAAPTAVNQSNSLHNITAPGVGLTSWVGDKSPARSPPNPASPANAFSVFQDFTMESVKFSEISESSMSRSLSASEEAELSAYDLKLVEPPAEVEAVTNASPASTASSEFRGFMAGNNRQLVPSEASMSRARVLTASDDDDVEPSAGDLGPVEFRAPAAAVAVTPVARTAIDRPLESDPSPPAFQGFMSGNNRPLEISDASMYLGRALMASVDDGAESSAYDLEPVELQAPAAALVITPASSEFQGFMSGNNRQLVPSEASMSRARVLMASDDDDVEPSAGDLGPVEFRAPAAAMAVTPVARTAVARLPERVESQAPAAEMMVTPVARPSVARHKALHAAPSTQLPVPARVSSQLKAITPYGRSKSSPKRRKGSSIKPLPLVAVGSSSLSGPSVTSRPYVTPRVDVVARTSSSPAIEDGGSHTMLLQAYNADTSTMASRKGKRRRLSFSSPRVVSKPKPNFSPMASISESSGLSFSDEESKSSPTPTRAKISLATFAGSDMLQNMSCEVALRHGVHKNTLAITPSNAVEYRFYRNAGSVGGSAGWSDARTAIISQGCDKKFCSDAWVRNHYRWIVWKLGSYDRRLPMQSTDRHLGWAQVLKQLLHRYRREFVFSERSCLKKILEKDEAPSRFMVLCVASVTFVPKAGCTAVAELELTDGWYFVRACLDSHLSLIANKGSIFVGQKLRIVNATIGGTTDAVTPLEAHEAYLNLCVNSTRRALWNARLGLQPGAGFVVNLASVKDGGGLVSCIRAIVTRQYPMQFLDKGESGCKVHRNEMAEERANQRHIRNCERKLEDLSASMQKGSRQCSEEEVEAAILSLKNSDPAFVRQPLPYFKVKISELVADWDKHFLPGDAGAEAPALLSGTESNIMLWKGSEEMMSFLVEGQMLSVWNLMPTSYGGRVGLSNHSYINIKPLKLPSGPFVPAQLTAVAQHLCRKNCSPCHLHTLSTGDEFDFAAFVVHTVAEKLDERQQRQARLYCADFTDEMLIVEIFDEDNQVHQTGDQNLRSVVLMSNLEYIGYDARNRIHSAGASIRSAFVTRLPRGRAVNAKITDWGACMETAVCDLLAWGASEQGRTDLIAKQRHARFLHNPNSPLLL